MSYAILRNVSYKNEPNTFTNIYKHNARLKTKYSNKDINVELSKNNFYIKKPIETFYKSVKKVIEDTSIEKHLQKSSKVLSEMLVTSDEEFFSKMTFAEQKKFFETAYKFIANKIGKDIILSATVHLDEKTPHMHVNYIPISNINGKRKLSVRDMWKGKNSYHELQNEYYNFIVKEQGYNLERGEVKTERKNLSVSEYKEVTNYENNSKIERDINKKYWNKELKESKDIIKPKSTLTENEGLMKKGTYNKADVDNIVVEYKKEVSELSRQSDLKDTIINDIGKDYRSISDKWIMSKAERLEKENVELKRENKYLKIILNIYEKAMENLKELLLLMSI